MILFNLGFLEVGHAYDRRKVNTTGGCYLDKVKSVYQNDLNTFVKELVYLCE